MNRTIAIIIGILALFVIIWFVSRIIRFVLIALIVTGIVYLIVRYFKKTTY